MAIGNGIRAFSNHKYDYYELTKPIGCGYRGTKKILPAGSVFVHDIDDHEQGSIDEGCLKLCWKPDGNCYGMLCANTVVLHAAFKDSDMFKIVQRGQNSKARELEEKLDTLESYLIKLKNEMIKLKDELSKLCKNGGD